MEKSKETKERFIRLVMANGRSRVVTESIAKTLMATGNYEWAGEHIFPDRDSEESKESDTSESKESDTSESDTKSENPKVRRRSKASGTPDGKADGDGEEGK